MAPAAGAAIYFSKSRLFMCFSPQQHGLYGRFLKGSISGSGFFESFYQSPRLSRLTPPVKTFRSWRRGSGAPPFQPHDVQSLSLRAENTAQVRTGKKDRQAVLLSRHTNEIPPGERGRDHQKRASIQLCHSPHPVSSSNCQYPAPKMANSTLFVVFCGFLVMISLLFKRFKFSLEFP